MSSKVVINSLDVMESIVAKNRNLEWDGWDVVHINPKASSFMKPRAVFRNGEWHVATRYPVTEDGWTVPGWLTNVAR